MYVVLRDAAGRGGSGAVPKVGVKDSNWETDEVLRKLGARVEVGLVLLIGGLSDRVFTTIEIGIRGGVSGILFGRVGDLAPVIVELTFV